MTSLASSRERAAGRPIFYRLCATDDPEERLEDAAMWKALRDEFGETITSGSEDETPAADAVVFGRSRKFAPLSANPVSAWLPYWTDLAFIENAQRSFEALPFNEAIEAVRRLHATDKGAFVKSTRQKHAIFRIPVGVDPRDDIGEMAYSFIDGGPALMVQELVTVEYEHRFFCIDHEVVTFSPVQVKLTPIDRLRPGTMYRTPRASEPDFKPAVFARLETLASQIARSMREPHAVVDCGLINGQPGAIEFNPMRIGECGLFACNVRALAKAARKLIPSTPTHPGTKGATDAA